MNRRHLLLIISYFFVILITISCGSKPEDSDYMPLKAGSYEFIRETMQGEEKSSTKSTLNILEPREIDGLKVIPNEVIEPGSEVIITDFYLKKDDGIVMAGDQLKVGDKINPPTMFKKEGMPDHYILKYPISAGKKWEYKTENGLITYEYEKIDEEIQVENHTYKNCVRLKTITIEHSGGEEKTVQNVTLWLAPGIGHVKYIADVKMAEGSSHMEGHLIR